MEEVEELMRAVPSQMPGFPVLPAGRARAALADLCTRRSEMTVRERLTVDTVTKRLEECQNMLVHCAKLSQVRGAVAEELAVRTALSDIDGHGASPPTAERAASIISAAEASMSAALASLTATLAALAADATILDTCADMNREFSMVCEAGETSASGRTRAEARAAIGESEAVLAAYVAELSRGVFPGGSPAPETDEERSSGARTVCRGTPSDRTSDRDGRGLHSGGVSSGRNIAPSGGGTEDGRGGAASQEVQRRDGGAEAADGAELVVCTLAQRGGGVDLSAGVAQAALGGSHSTPPDLCEVLKKSQKSSTSPADKRRAARRPTPPPRSGAAPPGPQALSQNAWQSQVLACPRRDSTSQDQGPGSEAVARRTCGQGADRGPGSQELSPLGSGEDALKRASQDLQLRTTPSPDATNSPPAKRARVVPGPGSQAPSTHGDAPPRDGPDPAPGIAPTTPVHGTVFTQQTQAPAHRAPAPTPGTGISRPEPSQFQQLQRRMEERILAEAVETPRQPTPQLLGAAAANQNPRILPPPALRLPATSAEDVSHHTTST